MKAASLWTDRASFWSTSAVLWAAWAGRPDEASAARTGPSCHTWADRWCRSRADSAAAAVSHHDVLIAVWTSRRAAQRWAVSVWRSGRTGLIRTDPRSCFHAAPRTSRGSSRPAESAAEPQRTSADIYRELEIITCVCVCVCVCECVCVCVCVWVCVCESECEWVSVWEWVWVCVCESECVWERVCVCECEWVSECVRVSVSEWVCESVCVRESVCVCVRVFVTNQDIDLYNDTGMTQVLQGEGDFSGHWPMSPLFKTLINHTEWGFFGESWNAQSPVRAKFRCRVGVGQ